MTTLFLSPTVFLVSARLCGSSVGAFCLTLDRFNLVVSLLLVFSSVVGKVMCVRAGSGALQPLCVQQSCSKWTLQAAPFNNALCNKMKIEDLAKKIIEDQESSEDYSACSKFMNYDLPRTFNELSIYLAKSFLNGSISYSDADFAMNGVWPAMLDYTMEKNISLVEPCYSIYCAFDEGEYDHKDGSDPVEKYTKPALSEVLQSNA